MKRLSEIGAELSRAEGQLLGVLEAHDDEPLSEFERRRILNRVRAAGGRSGRVPVLRLLGVAALLTSGTLLGAWGAGWLGAGEATEETPAPPEPPGALAPAVPERSVARGQSSADGDALPVKGARGEDAATDDNAGSLVEVSPRLPTASARTRRAEPPAGEDPTLVAEALRALRQEREPERAEALLRRYRAANPDGALSEDALALAIEAAAERDPKHAARLAREYLVKYPHGRYRSTAERALRLESKP